MTLRSAVLPLIALAVGVADHADAQSDSANMAITDLPKSCEVLTEREAAEILGANVNQDDGGASCAYTALELRKSLDQKTRMVMVNIGLSAFEKFRSAEVPPFQWTRRLGNVLPRYQFEKLGEDTSGGPAFVAHDEERAATLVLIIPGIEVAREAGGVATREALAIASLSDGKMSPEERQEMLLPLATELAEAIRAGVGGF